MNEPDAQGVPDASGPSPVHQDGQSDHPAIADRGRYVSTFTALSQQIRAAGLLERRYGYYWSAFAVTTLLFAAIWVAFAFVGNSWFQLALAAALAAVLTQFGFLGHDAAHRQIFASHRWSVWASMVVSGLFTGLSYGWWLSKHNRHHANPNKEGADPDVGAGAFAFTPAAVQTRKSRLTAWLTARQGYYFFPLLLLEGLALHIASIQTIMRRNALAHRWWEAAFIAIRLGGYVTVLLLVLPPSKAAAFIGVQLGVFGLLLGGSFAPNHIGMPIVAPDEKIDFLHRQVLMSRNIRGGWPMDIALGGLNHQIEHHLFPNMPRPNLRRARAIVREYCDQRQITYTETGLMSAYRVAVRHLNAVGRGAADPFRCPLATRLRS